ncbi:MAG: glycosyltransferase [Bacteroidota bacterium]|nr:glycosyltransferase [Bacteroidota bacterium]MDP4195602.1 glycosyltransferase [Bacteroidota bacterium]
MKYSIIIPTLNEEKLLPKLLEQIRSSKIKEKYDAELIISDGGSTDSTLQIAEEYADKVVLHCENRRQNIAEGRNLGVNEAKGDILIFLGADVLFNDVSAFFQILNDRFEKSHFLAMTCDVKIFPEEEIWKDKIFHKLLNTYFYLLNVFGVGMGRGECQIIRKKVFQDFNGYNTKLAAGEDFDLFKRVRKKGEILYARDLCVYESPRRYRKYGYLNVCKSWFINAYYVIFKKRSMDQEWEQIR